MTPDELKDKLVLLTTGCEKATEALATLTDDLDELHEPYAMSKVEARNEAFELGDIDLQVRQIKSAVSNVHKIADALQRDLERRISGLMSVAELPNMPVNGKKFFPQPKQYVKMKVEYSDTQMHDVLRDLGYPDVVKTEVGNGTIKTTVLELMKKRGISEVPKELAPFIELLEVPSVSVRS